MIFKIILTATGDDFIPENILAKLKGHFQIASMNAPTDKKFKEREDTYGFGSVSFFHPKKFSTEETIIEYEEWLINFLLSNHQLFVNEGVKSFQYSLEVYYDGDQCNFEIFNSKQLTKLNNIEISFPVSIYRLGTSELIKWEKETKVDWQAAKN